MFNLCQRISWCVRVSQIIGSYCSVGTALARYTRVPWFDSRLRLVLTNLTFGAQCKYPLYDIPWGYASRVLRTLVKIPRRISQGGEICQRVSKYESVKISGVNRSVDSVLARYARDPGFKSRLRLGFLTPVTLAYIHFVFNVYILENNGNIHIYSFVNSFLFCRMRP